jgi:hypothetical protein
MKARASMFSACLLVLLTQGGLSAAPRAAPTIETTPIPVLTKPDFSKMFLGTWRCSTKSSRRAWSYETTSTAHVSSDGYWLVTKSAVAKTPVNGAFQSTDLVTYDFSRRRWVDIETDDQGNYDVTTSPGWRGSTIVWTDAFAPKSAGIASANPTSLTRVSAIKYTSLWSFVELGGRVVTVKSLCNKVSD